MAIYQKLLELQRRVTALGKDGTGDKYQYVTGNKLLGVVRPIMDEIGLLLITEVKEATYTRQDYNTRNGQKSEMFCAIKMLFTWVDAESGETLPCEWASSGMNNFDKSVGSAQTYGERLFIMKTLHLQTDEDDVDAVKSPEEEMSDLQAIDYINGLKSVDALNAAWAQYGEPYWKGHKDIIKAYNLRKKTLTNGTAQG